VRDFDRHIKRKDRDEGKGRMVVDTKESEKLEY
jgi:hypothetical protein